MSSMAIPVPARSIFAPPTSHSSDRLHRRHFIASSIHHRAFSFSVDINLANPTNFSTSSSSGIRSSQSEDAETSETENFSGAGEGEDEGAQKVSGDQEKKTTGVGSTFLVKLAIALGIAATVTLVSIGFKNLMHGPSPGAHYLADGSSASTLVDPSAGFTFKAFGRAIVIPQYAPGWIYFWLLMAAGCGLFISEEALNIWVGISLARLLSLDGTWQSFVQSFSRNAPYIISTVLWVYWGVCISDMIPFYLGKLFRRSGASNDVYSKLGISKEKAADVTNAVQRYGNLIGFVERFSLGVRNPTAFLAGALDISPEYFFAGVCCGGLITLPVQLTIGFLLRKRPMVAVATVASAVGIWTVLPYLIAASTAMFIYLRRRFSS